MRKMTGMEEGGGGGGGGERERRGWTVMRDLRQIRSQISNSKDYMKT